MIDQHLPAPFEARRQWGLLRVNGCITEYCVIDEIDVHALRQFQSSHCSSTTSFKPMQDELKIDLSRKVFPAEDK